MRTIFTFSLEDAVTLATLTPREINEALNAHGILGKYQMLDLKFEHFTVTSAGTYETNDNGYLQACYSFYWWDHEDDRYDTPRQVAGRVFVWLTPEGRRADF